MEYLVPILSIILSAGCCLLFVVVLAGVVWFMTRKPATVDEDPLAGPGPALDMKPEPPPPAEEPLKADLGPGPDLFDDEEMATVVAPPPPGLVGDVPSAPPPPPPKGGPPPAPSLSDAPPPPPKKEGPPARTSGQTIIAFDDDDEDW